MDLIFFGMQGAGKGTIGKLVAHKYGLEVFETGGELRKLSAEDSELGKKVKAIIEAGNLVSNEVVMEIVENFMKNLGEGKSVLFDGIPRKVVQAETLNALLEKYKREYKGVLLEISMDTALARLTTRRICDTCKTVFPADYKGEKCECGGTLTVRKDDNASAIHNRLDAFQNETMPAIQMYADKLIKINGEGSIEEVEKLAYEILDPLFA
ncbi:MAG: nucleoside monophosphate kinase [bacterium]|nr:nucleoside monophosphate kinase [bacterium]